MTKGIVYIAVGKEYTELAQSAAESVRAHSPKLSIQLYTDQLGFQHDIFDGISMIENPHKRSKVDYLPETPFERTLYLDVDTQVVSDITPMFDILDRFDLAIAHAHRRNHKQTSQVWNVEVPDSFPQMNGGVLLFKNSIPTMKLLKDWREAYPKAGFMKDQVTLRELIWQSDLRISILPPEYNIRYEKYLSIWDSKEAAPKILHYRSFKQHIIEKKPLRHKLGKFKRKLLGL